MKKQFFVIFVVIVLLLSIKISFAALIDITSPDLTHFASFTNDPPSGDIWDISDNPATSYGDFGWHQHSDSTFPDYAGILETGAYTVTELRFQVHINPFKEFVLQGSNNTTDGLDGTWIDIFSGTVTNRNEYEWQKWDFSNTDTYSAYRIQINSDYTSNAGWAMYRWQLMAEDGPSNPAPEPATCLFLIVGLLGMLGIRKKFC
jgi:hypothetical protein